jgi:hypothetical protein
MLAPNHCRLNRDKKRLLDKLEINLVRETSSKQMVANKHHMFMIGIMGKKEKPISIIELGKRNSCRFKQYNSEAF